MQNAIHESSADLLLRDFQSTSDTERPLTLGQTVVICGGILKGATGTLVKTAAPGQYLVSLSEQKGRIWAVLPAPLLREI